MYLAGLEQTMHIKPIGYGRSAANSAQSLPDNVSSLVGYRGHTSSGSLLSIVRLPQIVHPLCLQSM